MDRISGLHDDLLVKILSYVPTKIAVSTCILSKRWEFLWMWLPKLVFISKYGHYKGPMLRIFRDFIDKNLPLHRAPVIESFRLHLWDTSYFEPKYIKRWIEIAVSRYIRELEICYHQKKDNIFPSSLFTCKSLMTLKLKDMVWLPIHVPSMASLPSLKTLLLENVSFVDGKSLQELLSVCPLLEDLKVFSYDNIKQFSINVPSLQTLSLVIHHSTGYVINTPSLKYLKFEDRSYVRLDYLIKHMPKLREAYVDVRYFNPPSVIGSITSAKRLTICNISEALYGDGVVFNQLEHLKLCVKRWESLNLLGQLLQNSPNLRVLDISIEKDDLFKKSMGMICWNQPNSVPVCLLSSLQIFKWSRYFGRPQDRDMAVYILKNARHLKTATFLADTSERFTSKLQMIKELTLSSRASSICELVFVEDFFKD